MLKDLTEVKTFQKVFWGATFFETPGICELTQQTEQL